MDPFYPCTLSFPHQVTAPVTASSGRSSSNVEKIPYEGGVYWRVFLHSEIGLEHCLQSLPEKFNAKKFLQRYIRGTDCSQDGGDKWEAAEESFLECKKMLLEVEAIFGNDKLELGHTRDFLLAWALLPLAELYQSRGNADTFEKAMDVRKEILDLIMPLQSSHALLVQACRSSLTSSAESNQHKLTYVTTLLTPCAPLLGGFVGTLQLLAQVPFAALQDKQRENKCLIECHTIAMTTSLSVVKICSDRLLELQRRSDPLVSGSKIIALADPKYDACPDCQAYIGTHPGWLQRRHTPLPGTRKEVDEIVEVFGKENSQKVVTLSQKQASTQILLEAMAACTSGDHSLRQAIIHIGAHANANERDRWKSAALSLACPWDSISQSAIIAGFSLVSTDDGRAVTANVTEELDMKIYSTHDLKFKDICRSEPRWSAELVVLSACETSRGRLYMLESCCSTPERPREGIVMSLVRALHIAGVPCVVASLWSICDKATPPLMKKFYEELREGNDVATALQSAMLHSMILMRRERTRHNWLIALNNMLQNLPARKLKLLLKWRVAAHSIMRHNVRERLRRRVWAPFNVWGEFSLQIPEDLRKIKPNAS